MGWYKYWGNNRGEYIFLKFISLQWGSAGTPGDLQQLPASAGGACHAEGCRHSIIVSACDKGENETW